MANRYDSGFGDPSRWLYNPTHNQAGGVLIAIKSAGIESVCKIPLPNHLQELQVVLVLITMAQDQKVLFCSFYWLPNLDFSWVNSFNIPGFGLRGL